MNDITIILVAHNQIKETISALESIRLFADYPNFSVVLIDNSSSDGLADYAKCQNDITYVFMDEGYMPTGLAINEVVKALGIHGDIVIWDVNYWMTPKTLENMQSLLYQEENTGAVCAASNTGEVSMGIKAYSSFDEAINHSLKSKELSGKYVLGFDTGVFILKDTFFYVYGGFDGYIENQDILIQDMGLKLLSNEFKLKICYNAYAWDTRLSNEKIDPEDRINVLEKKWGIHYLNLCGNDFIIDTINEPREKQMNILEIGCNCGATLLEILNRYPNTRVYGSELNPDAARIASFVATVKVDNIEEQVLEFDNIKFDYIIFGDVLEHLRNPQRALEYCKNLLSENGQIIASIPNMMHISVVGELLNGNFTYTETGLLDKTHIHMFTYNEIVRLFSALGYEISSISSILLKDNDKDELIEALLSLGNGTERFMYETFQYIVKARIK